MPAEYRIDVAKRVVRCRAWGVLSDQDLEDYQAAVSADPAFESDLGQLYDGTDIMELQITSATLVGKLQKSGFAPNARRAFVPSLPRPRERRAVARL